MSEPRYQIGRVARVLVYKQATDPKDPSDYFGKLGNAVEILGGLERFRIQFKIKLTSGKHANTCELTINNLNHDTRTAIVKRPLTVIVEAGYDPDYRLLFTGDVKRGSGSEPDGPDWKTTIFLGDGERALNHAYADGRQYKAGTPVRSIVQDAARSLGLSLPDDVANLSVLSARTTTDSVLEGWAADELERLLAPYGYHFSIQRGRLQVLADETSRPETARLISEDNGMIGSLSYGAPDEKGTPPSVKVKTTLYPELTPGGRVQVKSSREGSGLYRVVSVEHSGDTDGSDWQTELELKSIT